MLTDKLIYGLGERLGKEARENGCTEPQRGDYEALQEVVGAKDFAEVSDHIQRVFESGWKQA